MRNCPCKLAMPQILSRRNFPRLLEVLQAAGYTVIGPQISNKSVIYDEISSVDDLPAGWTRCAGGGNLSPDGTRRWRAVRLYRGRAILEALPVPPAAHALAGRARRRRLHDPGTERGGAALRLSRHAGLRIARHRDPGPCLPARRPDRDRLCGPAAGGLLHRRQLRPGRRNLLLRLDGQRPAGASRLRSGADGTDRRHAATSSCWRSEARAAPPWPRNCR